MLDGVRQFRARISCGERVADVVAERPEMLAAGIIEETRRLVGGQVAPGAVHVSIGASLEFVDGASAAIETVRSAIAAEVRAAQGQLQRADEMRARFGEQALVPFQGKAAIVPEKETERLQTLRPLVGDVVILDEEGETDDLPQIVEDRLRTIGVLTVGKPTPLLDEKGLRQRLAGLIEGPDFAALVGRYDALPLLEDVIEDPNIRRLCSALTATGFETRYSCEGHGWMLAHAKFVADPERLAELRTLLAQHADRLNERWVLEEDHRDPSTIRYILHPDRITDSVGTRYDGVMADMDVIGMLLLSRFGAPGAKPA